MFPASKRDRPLGTNDFCHFWTATRDAAGIAADARLHDLRHSQASRSVMNGESLNVAVRMLGRRRASTTNRHVHPDDATPGQAAEREARTVKRKLHAAASE